LSQSPDQHDDHCWLCADGMWAIHSMRWPLVLLWRGYDPDIEYMLMDLSKVDWDAYYAKAIEMIERARKEVID
jgi:hypothetical protein